MQNLYKVIQIFITDVIGPTLSIALAIITLFSIFTLPWYIGVTLIVALLLYLLYRAIDCLKDPPDVTWRVVQEFTIAPHHVLFVYGSLLIPDSILRSIAKAPRDLECIPCRLKNYRLAWGAMKARDDLLTNEGHPFKKLGKWASAVAVEGSFSDSVAGALIGVTREEYLALKERESSYYLKNITSDIEITTPAANKIKRNIEVFLPRSLELFESSQVNEPVLIRKKYFDGINKSLKRFCFSSLSLPPAATLEDASFVPEIIAPKLNKPQGKKLLAELQSSISRDLVFNDEFRNTALRPLVLPRSKYNQVKDVAEACIGLSVKALKVIAHNEQLARWAGYSDEDVSILKCANDRGQLLPQITRVDMTLFGNKIYVFECNTDSPGGMRHLDIISKKQAEFFCRTGDFEWIDCHPSNATERTIDALLRVPSNKAGNVRNNRGRKSEKMAYISRNAILH